MPKQFRAAAAAVILWLGAVTAQAAGFDNHFTVRSGDLNADGRTDLYLKWTPKFTMVQLDDLSFPVPRFRREMPDFVLQQTTGGTFTVVSLTPAQQTQVQQWPRAPSAVALDLSDINFDGAFDLVIRNLAVLIPGIENQIVVASAAAGSVPTRAIPFSPTVRNFYRDVEKWFLAPLVTEQRTEREYTYLGYSSASGRPSECAPYQGCVYFYDDVDDPGAWFPDNDPAKPDVYHWWGWKTETRSVTFRDYDVTDPNAQRFVQALDTTLASGEIISGSLYTRVMQDVLNRVWGAGVVNMEQNPVSPVDEPLKDNWRWYQVMGHIGKIFLQVCVWEGGQRSRCFFDIWADGFPPIDVCATHGPFEPGGPYFNYAITARQRSLASTDQRRDFWVSRYRDSCDPFAPAALGVVDERGLGMVTMRWLRAVASHKGLQIDEQQLGLAIMDAHVAATDSDVFNIIHLLSKKQISDYHQDVFSDFGLPDYTFGGAPFGNDSPGGVAWERASGEIAWCPDCDKIP